MQPWMIQVRTYLNGAWHYRWTAMAIAWAICIVGWIGIAFIPNQFQAIAKIYVDTDTMMAPLLKGLTVTTNSQQQVSVMLNTLLTRPNRSEERRVGKECRSRGSPDHYKKKKNRKE